MTSWSIGSPGGEVLLLEHFGPADLQRLRAMCYALAIRAGLDEGRALRLVFAINEGTANAVLHGDGGGQLTLLRTTAGRLIAQVVDNGPGLTAPIPDDLPAADSPGGRGLWAARRMVDDMTLTTTDEGTTLRLEVAIARPVNDPWVGAGDFARFVPHLASILFEDYAPNRLGRNLLAMDWPPKLDDDEPGTPGPR